MPNNVKILIVLIVILLSGALFYRFFILDREPELAATTFISDYDLSNKDVKVGNLNFGKTDGLKKAAVTFYSSEEMADKLEFDGAGRRENNSLLWNDGKRDLLVSSQNTFDFTDAAGQIQTPIKNEEEAENLARSFLNNLGIFTDDLKLELKKTYLVGEGERNEAPSFDKATYVAHTFDLKYLGKKVMVLENSLSEFEVWVDRNSNIARFSGPLPLKATDSQNVELGSDKDALALAREKKGTVLFIAQVDEESNTGFDQTYKAINFSRGEIAYQVTEAKLTPIYLLIGVAKNPGNEDLEVYLSLPAEKAP